MSPFEVRRSTTDDLPQLLELWRVSHLPAELLEKRFTEFQVAQAATGGLVAAVGMQLSEKQGLIHSEAISDFALTDSVRPLLWQRLRTMAQNHGLVRLWTQEEGPFWKQEGFVAPAPPLLEKLPAVFGPREGRWLHLQLRDEAALPTSVDAEFARFKEMEQERTRRIMGQARVFKWIALLIAFALFAFVVGGAIYLWRYRR